MPGLCTNSVGDKVWSFLGFSASCELSATSVGDGVVLCSGWCSSGLDFGCIHEVNRENVEDSPFIALGGMAAALAKGASCTARFELKMATDPMGMICVDTHASQEALDWTVHKVCKGQVLRRLFKNVREML